jgi:hypothetical protein
VLHEGQTETQGKDMSAHTPGPWSKNGLPRDFIGIETDDVYVAHVLRDGHTPDGGPLQAVANARLIAAAPELLAAAKAALAYDAAIWRRGQDGTYDTDPLGAIAEGHDLDALYMDWRNKARDAVAKATGATELETATR